MNSQEIITQYHRLTGVLGSLNQYYEYLLSEDAEAMDYCMTVRGLSSEAISYYHLGLGPSVMKVLEFFKANDINRDDAFAAGAVFDMFEDRLMFPVYDLVGGIVGYSARAWRGDLENVPKYVNSPKNSLYWKSLYLYGMYQALPYIEEAGYALVVEGNLDVITLVQAGIGPTVAPCGTAITKQQLQILKTFTTNIVFKFDNDIAGKKAAKKAQGFCEELGLTYRSFDFIGAKDPDEYVRKYGIDLFLNELGKALA